MATQDSWALQVGAAPLQLLVESWLTLVAAVSFEKLGLAAGSFAPLLPKPVRQLMCTPPWESVLQRMAREGIADFPKSLIFGRHQSTYPQGQETFLDI